MIWIIVILISTLYQGMVMTNENTKAVLEKATFAGGCFWCMTPPFQKLKGVQSVISGYAGGTGDNPTYKDYAHKGHIEAIQISFDPRTISYEALLDVFWRQIDPTDPAGQFVDRGPQYRSAIFFHTDDQKKKAEHSRKVLMDSGRFKKQVVTEILPLTTFYPAEEYHQDYHTKNPIRYSFYRYRSGRDQFLSKTWKAGNEMNAGASKNQKKPSEAELRTRLTPLQYTVTQEGGTEKAFENEYWDTKDDGIYVDRVSGEPLFSSRDKYDSGTGWPSFTQPIDPQAVVLIKENDSPNARTEVKSRMSDAHLGHVFNDGPAPTGLRYCMNSAALRFIPVGELEAEGYGSYRKLFKK